MTALPQDKMRIMAGLDPAIHVPVSLFQELDHLPSNAHDGPLSFRANQVPIPLENIHKNASFLRLNPLLTAAPHNGLENGPQHGKSGLKTMHSPLFRTI